MLQLLSSLKGGFSMKSILVVFAIVSVVYISGCSAAATDSTPLKPATTNEIAMFNAASQEVGAAMSAIDNATGMGLSFVKKSMISRTLVESFSTNVTIDGYSGSLDAVLSGTVDTNTTTFSINLHYGVTFNNFMVTNTSQGLNGTVSYSEGLSYYLSGVIAAKLYLSEVADVTWGTNDIKWNMTLSETDYTNGSYLTSVGGTINGHSFSTNWSDN
jgi:hypothetical protein